MKKSLPVKILSFLLRRLFPLKMANAKFAFPFSNTFVDQVKSCDIESKSVENSQIFGL